jgi:hypothetical protein
LGLFKGLIQAFGAWYSLAQLIAWVLSLLAVESAHSRQVSGTSNTRHYPPAGSAGPGEVSGDSTTQASATDSNPSHLLAVAPNGSRQDFGVPNTRHDRPSAGSRDVSRASSTLQTLLAVASPGSRPGSRASSSHRNPTAAEDERIPLSAI